MLLRQEVFDDVAKTLEADPQLVKCNPGSAAHRTAMQIVGVQPSFERDVLKNHTSLPQPRRSALEFDAPTPPLFAIEFIECEGGFLFMFDFASGEKLKQGDGAGIRRRR